MVLGRYSQSNMSYQLIKISEAQRQSTLEGRTISAEFANCRAIRPPFTTLSLSLFSRKRRREGGTPINVIRPSLL